MEARAEVPAINFMLMLAGLWLIATAFAFGYPPQSAPQENAFFVGLTVLVIAFVCAISVAASRWLSWVNVILGVWMVMAPFVLGYTGIRIALLNDMIVGVIITGLALWSVVESHRVPASLT